VFSFFSWLELDQTVKNAAEMIGRSPVGFQVFR